MVSTDMNTEYQLDQEENTKYSAMEHNSQVTPNDNTSCTRVNMYMLPAKLAYIFKMALYDKILFSMLYYLSIGLTPIQAGLINGFQHIGGLVGAPIIGVLADKTRKYRLIARCCCILAVITNIMQPAFKFVYSDEINKLFPILLVLSISATAFETSAISFVDSGVLQRIRDSPRKANYGVQRLFGGIGTAVGSLSDSIAVKYFPSSFASSYTGIFLPYTVFVLLLLITSYYLLDNVHIAEEITQTSNGTFKDLLIRALKSSANIFFFINVLLNGSIQALLNTFLYVYMKEFNAPVLVFGLGMVFAGISASVLYLTSSWLLNKIGGPKNAFCLAWFCMGIRLFAAAYLCPWNPYMIIVPELLQGPTYSLFWLSSVEYVNSESHSSILTTMCGIMNSLFNPCSFLFANVLGSKMYVMLGGKVLFVGSGVFCFVWALLFSVYVFAKDKRSQPYEYIP